MFSVMKKILFFSAIFASLSVFAQPGKKSPHDTVTYANGKVTYGRPYKNGREIFGSLVKYGKVWRLGADEATTISFNTDTKFAGVGVPAGTYTLFAIPNEMEWTIVLNSQPGQWGAFGYEKIKDKNVAEINVPVGQTESVVEQLTIRFDDKNNMLIEWDKARITVPLSF
jgi:hypothetical protein